MRRLAVALAALLLFGAVTLMSPQPAQAWVGDCHQFVDYTRSAGTGYCDGGPPTVFYFLIHCKLFGFIDDYGVGELRTAGSGQASYSSCVGTVVDHQIIVISSDQA
jgi:hypothetical protein